MKLYEQKIALLREIANEIRKTTGELAEMADETSFADAAALAEVFATLYFYVLRHDPKNPAWSERDVALLSDKNATPALYAALSYADYFSREVLASWRGPGAALPAYPQRNILYGIESTAQGGGLGLGEAAGIARAARFDEKNRYVYCILSGAEHFSGALWEAAMAIGDQKLSNCIVIAHCDAESTDRGAVRAQSPASLKEKYEAFGWQVLEIDGHDIEAIIAATREARETHEKPTAIIAYTVSRPGVGTGAKNRKKHIHA